MPIKKKSIIAFISDCRSTYDAPKYDNISDFSKSVLCHVLALTPSIDKNNKKQNRIQSKLIFGMDLLFYDILTYFGNWDFWSVNLSTLCICMYPRQFIDKFTRCVLHK